MRVEVKVPQLPESVAEATLVSWHKKVGDKVARDENLVDVETDKVVLELPAPQAGVLVEIRQADGATVAGQQVIAVIDSDAAAAASPSAPAVAVPAAVSSSPASTAPPAAAPAALPAARKMMADLGVSPAAVDGTGRGGRITKGDVIAASATAPQRIARRRPLPGRAPTSRRHRRSRAQAWRRAVRSSACRCPGCGSAWPSGSCSRSRPPRS